MSSWGASATKTVPSSFLSQVCHMTKIRLPIAPGILTPMTWILLRLFGTSSSALGKLPSVSM
jgi:hypothetical protein